MSHTLQNQTQVVSITAGNFAHPANPAIDKNGDWLIYLPNSGNATLAAKIKPYRWGVAPTLTGGVNELTISGTIALIDEVVGGSTIQYHGSTVEHIGAGINDITNQVESDAYFFNHLGSLSPATDDDAFYWDRVFQATGSTDLTYYQYHKHLPAIYAQYENGRLVMNGDGYIRPADKAYASLINTEIKVSQVQYQSVLLRVHTPSVGGAHNSHNDITLPTVNDANYMMGGVLKGLGDRYHIFYITQAGSDWRVYNRTYVDSTGSCTVEVDLGSFNLADPTFVFGTNCYDYPIRASAGDLYDGRIYIPVLLNNATSGYDLEIWSFISNNTVAGGSLIRTPIVLGAPARPDAQLCTVGDNIFAAISNTSTGGVDLWVYENGLWEKSTTKIATNSNANILRVHGIRFNTNDTKIYTLISGVSSATGTYTGPGLYSSELVGDFGGYKHLDFDVATNSFVFKNNLDTGHLIFDNATAEYTRSASSEPQGISVDKRILSYGTSKPSFYNHSIVSLGGTEYVYHGILLGNNRKALCGRIEDLPYGKGRGDLFVAIVDEDNDHINGFAFGGINGDTVDPNIDVRGDDYITGVVQSKIDPNKLWITGYTKSELTPKKDMYIHGFCRRTSDSPNYIEWDDTVIDTSGNIYLVGSSADGYGKILKYNSSYIAQWQYQFADDNEYDGKSIAIDSNGYLYIAGSASNGSSYVVKLDQDGQPVWMNSFAKVSNTESSTSIAIVTKSGQEFVVTGINSGTSTIFTVLTVLDGSILEQKEVTGLTVNRIRNHISTADGKYLFAGTGSSVGKFGCGEILTGVNPILWISQYETSALDIVNIDAGPTYGYAVCGTSASDGFVLKVTATVSGSVWTVTKSWANKVSMTQFRGITSTHFSETDRALYVVGMSMTGGGPEMGMGEGIITSYTNSGTLAWQNVFGHMMDESFTSVVMDITGRNIIAAGWSESHTVARDSIIFRCEIGGFGTGVYHLNGNAGMRYYYLASTITNVSLATNITTLSLPSFSTASVVNSGASILFDISGATVDTFDGSYGANGNFMMFIGIFDLLKAQEFYNTQMYRDHIAMGRNVHYPPSEVFKFWQIATVGDGTADDGNVFGYDIIEAADGTIYAIGQTSGDVTMTNVGDSGVYDYLLVKFDPITEALEMYQGGGELDEETYTLCELANGHIAFAGRSPGSLGGTPQGGYDIFLGIYNPTTDERSYYSIGSGLDDKGVGIHDLGNDTLAIVYSSFGSIPGGAVGSGAEDIGVVLFNYNTDIWGNSYQTGTNNSEIFNQNGSPSALISDHEIAIAFSTGGSFDNETANQGFLDIAIGILDINTGTWIKSQVGSQSSEISTSVSASGYNLLISGYLNDSFSNDGNSIYVETDIGTTILGKSSSVM